jgi:hypothetical protein
MSHCSVSPPGSPGRWRRFRSAARPERNLGCTTARRAIGPTRIVPCARPEPNAAVYSRMLRTGESEQEQNLTLILVCRHNYLTLAYPAAIRRTDQ